MEEHSPYLGVIREGLEIRNRLLHRAFSEKVDDQKAVNYVNDIERAIFHLLSSLYKKNGLINSRARRITRSS